MLDLLFGIHIGGWQATFQFVFWTSIALAIVLRWMKRNMK
jgi:hypothetical protein